MRRIIVLTVATLAFVLFARDAGHRLGHDRGRRPPQDAHGQHSFFLRVRGYFRGNGGQRIEISDHADGDLPAEALQPGVSIAASREFIDRFAGQGAVVFAQRDVAPYAGQFTTNICTYTAYGDSAVADILPLLRLTFGSPRPPVLSATGPAAAPPLAIAAALLLGAGGALRYGARRRRSG